MGYFNAWIALVDEEGKVATALASSGFNHGFTPLGDRLRAGAYPDCMRQTLESEQVVVVRDPTADCLACPLAAEYGGRAGLSRRFRHGDRTYGVLSVSVPAAYARDPEERALFDEVAGDLAFALHKIEAAGTFAREPEGSATRAGAGTHWLVAF